MNRLSASRRHYGLDRTESHGESATSRRFYKAMTISRPRPRRLQRLSDPLEGRQSRHPHHSREPKVSWPSRSGGVGWLALTVRNYGDQHTATKHFEDASGNGRGDANFCGHACVRDGYNPSGTDADFHRTSQLRRFAGRDKTLRRFGSERERQSLRHHQSWRRFKLQPTVRVRRGIPGRYQRQGNCVQFARWR